MKKPEEQIEGQLNIFDYVEGPRPPQFEHRPHVKVDPCPGCIWMDRCCLWEASQSECRYKMNYMTEAEGWNRLKVNPNNGRVDGKTPENTESRRPLEAVIFTDDKRMHIAAGEGINQAIILPKGTPRGHVVAWRYFERGEGSDEQNI